MPLSIDEPGFRRMAELFDFDLDVSRVAVRDGTPVGLVNVGLRGASAWIGGMGVVPSERRAGIGEALMQAAHEAAAARGVAEVWLEVITSNTPAIRLYEKLGYEQIRDLEVWEIEAAPGPSTAREADVQRGTRSGTCAAPEPRTLAAIRRDARAHPRVGRCQWPRGRPSRRRRRPLDRRPRDRRADRRQGVDAAADILAGALAQSRNCGSRTFRRRTRQRSLSARLGSGPRLRQHELRLRLG